MSATVANTRLNVRIALGDLNAASYAISDERLTRMLVRQALLHNAIAGPSERWMTEGDGFTTAVNTYQYTLGISGLQHDAVLYVRRATDGYVLTRRRVEEIIEMIGDESNTGRVTDYAFAETTGPVLTLFTYPVADRVEVIDILTRPISTPATYTDATVVDGSEYLLRAIELATALEAMSRMLPADRERIKLSPEVVASWKADQVALLREERYRKDRLRAVSHVAGQVN